MARDTPSRYDSEGVKTRSSNRRKSSSTSNNEHLAPVAPDESPVMNTPTRRSARLSSNKNAAASSISGSEKSVHGSENGLHEHHKVVNKKVDTQMDEKVVVEVLGLPFYCILEAVVAIHLKNRKHRILTTIDTSLEELLESLQSCLDSQH